MKNNVFKYPDTNSTRAKIDFLNRKFNGQRIAIIGLGGTGSYVLDQVSKTPVSEIHLFDADFFLLHNAFRSPGAIAGEKLEVKGGVKKVQYYFEIYSNMHNGIITHDEFVTVENIFQLKRFDYVFICIDNNSERYKIMRGLLNLKVSFIDVGLGINLVDDSLIGTVRVTSGTSEKNDHLDNRIGSEELNKNEYSTNIQIADLNSLNAILAVIKWKKMSGFYQDLKKENNILYFINTNKTINEDPSA